MSRKVARDSFEFTTHRAEPSCHTQEKRVYGSWIVASLNSRLDSCKEEEEDPGERIFIELMTSDRKVKASREGSK